MPLLFMDLLKVEKAGKESCPIELLPFLHYVPQCAACRLDAALVPHSPIASTYIQARTYDIYIIL